MLKHLFLLPLIALAACTTSPLGRSQLQLFSDADLAQMGLAAYADIQEKDLDERMHTTPWFHATNLPNVPARNLVQIGIGGWQVPREAVRLAK